MLPTLTFCVLVCVCANEGCKYERYICERVTSTRSCLRSTFLFSFGVCNLKSCSKYLKLKIYFYIFFGYIKFISKLILKWNEKLTVNIEFYGVIIKAKNFHFSTMLFLYNIKEFCAMVNASTMFFFLSIGIWY